MDGRIHITYKRGGVR